MDFLNKEYLLLLLLLIPYVWWLLRWRKKSEPSMLMSDTFAYQKAPKSLRQRLTWLPHLLRAAVFVLVVLVLARPQTPYHRGHRHHAGNGCFYEYACPGSAS